jgi:hypothetical protein
LRLKSGVTAAVIVLSLAGCGSPRSAAAGAKPDPSSSPSVQPSTGQLASPVGRGKHFNMQWHDIPCSADYAAADRPVKSLVEGLRYPDQALLVQITSVGPAVWNTADGHQPTQAEADDPKTPEPDIYTLLHVQIKKTYSGAASSDPTTIYVEGGQVGDYHFTGCVTDMTHPPAPGNLAVVILGDKVSGGAGDHPSVGIFLPVKGNLVHNLFGQAEPVP